MRTLVFHRSSETVMVSCQWTSHRAHPATNLPPPEANQASRTKPQAAPASESEHFNRMVVEKQWSADQRYNKHLKLIELVGFKDVHDSHLVCLANLRVEIARRSELMSKLD